MNEPFYQVVGQKIEVDEDLVYTSILDYVNLVQRATENGLGLPASGILPEIDEKLESDVVEEKLLDYPDSESVARELSQDIIRDMVANAEFQQESLEMGETSTQPEPITINEPITIPKLVQNAEIYDLRAFEPVVELDTKEMQNKLTEAEIEELKGYRVGAFSNTIDNVDRINELTKPNGLLWLDLNNDEAQKAEQTEFMDMLATYRDQSSVDNFQDGQNNSAETQAIVSENTDMLTDVLSELRGCEPDEWLDVLKQRLPEIEAGMSQLKSLLSSNYWQFGGQPDDIRPRVRKKMLDIGIFG